ncbi:recombination protein NinB [Frischella sp. Ac13]|uniref:Recombination protein NinB n=1 Tax=Frischella japonica TaxID=2741544 RepID=A0ABR7QWU3_9GAMM|nr:recombination protein NinB [Frischella japonica]MBC9130702.1 recombination protein NinB [Frischella japonica]
MDDLCLHSSNIKSIFSTLIELVKSEKRYRLTIKIWKDKRTIDQNSLSHMWYTDIAKQANQRLKTNSYTMDSVKHDLKEMFLGYEEIEHKNVITGEMTKKLELIKTSDLDIGEMHFFLQQVESWSYQNGFKLRIPNNSEYRKLQLEQVA